MAGGGGPGPPSAGSMSGGWTPDWMVESGFDERGRCNYPKRSSHRGMTRQLECLCMLNIVNCCACSGASKRWVQSMNQMDRMRKG